MTLTEIEAESVVELPSRLETSVFFSVVKISQTAVAFNISNFAGTQVAIAQNEAIVG
jgi:hypothetical protein